MRTQRQGNGERTWQQTQPYDRRRVENVSAKLRGSNRAKEQRFGAEPSWCHPPISRDPPRGSNRGDNLIPLCA
jgi:hypothetical protein